MKCKYCKFEITEKESTTCIPSDIKDLNFTFHTICHKMWEDEKRWEAEMQRLTHCARRT